jgi:hypothetical protein
VPGGHGCPALELDPGTEHEYPGGGLVSQLTAVPFIDPVGQKYPGMQRLQLVAPESAKRPAGHSLPEGDAVSDPAGHTRPAVQLVHGVPPPPLYLPMGH